METIQFEYLNLIAAYMLHALVESQSVGKLSSLYAFKNVRNMEKFLEENAHAPDGSIFCPFRSLVKKFQPTLMVQSKFAG